MLGPPHWHGRTAGCSILSSMRTRRPVTPRAAELWFLLSLVLDFLRGCQWGPVSGGPSLSSCNADVNPPGRWNMAWIAPFLGGPAAGGGCQCHWQCQWPNGPSQASHPVAEAASPCPQPRTWERAPTRPSECRCTLRKRTGASAPAARTGGRTSFFFLRLLTFA
jgi:hypothetical protein